MLTFSALYQLQVKHIVTSKKYKLKKLRNRLHHDSRDMPCVSGVCGVQLLARVDRCSGPWSTHKLAKELPRNVAIDP
jgi:hypothetical protein